MTRRRSVRLIGGHAVDVRSEWSGKRWVQIEGLERGTRRREKVEKKKNGCKGKSPDGISDAVAGHECVSRY